jgi:hypothetical protein
MMTANTKSKFEGLNVNFPSKIYPLDADKYDAMKEAMLDILPKTGPGMTVPEIKERVGPILDGPLFPGGATLGWWIKAVQLDLEARGVITREPVSPIRLYAN